MVDFPKRFLDLGRALHNSPVRQWDDGDLRYLDQLVRRLVDAWPHEDNCESWFCPHCECLDINGHNAGCPIPTTRVCDCDRDAQIQEALNDE